MFGPVPGGPEGLLACFGHGRNGMLLVPVTAATVTALLRDEAVPEAARAADPGRFDSHTHTDTERSSGGAGTDMLAAGRSRDC